MSRPRSIAEDIQQSAPFRSRGQEALVSLLRTADDARRFLGRVLAREGVTLQQYNVLRILRGAGPDGLPTLDIAERMLQRQPGVTRLVDRLVTKGLATRARGEEDRRRVICTVTDRGLDLLERLEEPIADADRVLMADLDEEEQVGLIELLDRLRQSIADAGSPADAPD